MVTSSASFHSRSAEHTAQFAAALAVTLRAGDTILLIGDVGAGKTHFARHLIQAILEKPEDVPSPTFTLVQEYQTLNGPLWHSDLYRIGSTHEIEELGLSDAFDEAICLVEWPDRLAELTPTNALTLDFSVGPSDDTRQISARWTDAGWGEKLNVWADK